VIACLLPIINPTWEQFYYVVLLSLFAPEIRFIGRRSR
jgi:hypothetical protein